MTEEHNKEETQSPPTGGNSDREGARDNSEQVNSSKEPSQTKEAKGKKDEDKTIKELLIDIKNGQSKQTEEITGAISALKDSLDAKVLALNNLQQAIDAGKGGASELTSAALLQKEIKETLSAFRKELDKIAQANASEGIQFTQRPDLMQQYIEQMQSPIPDELKNPTLERMQDTLSKEEKRKLKETGKVGEQKWGEENERYHEMVEDWFEKRIREMETIELSFEEQQDTYRYLALYAHNFALKEETKQLGIQLRDKLEVRRIRHRFVRIWNLATPDGVLSEAPRVTISTYSKFFRDDYVGSYVLDDDGRRKKDKNGEYLRNNQVTRELQNYERMMRLLREKRDEYREKKLAGVDDKDLKKEIDIKERYIVDYFKFGGSIHDGGLSDAYVKDASGNDTKEDSDNFFVKLGTIDSNKKVINYTKKELVKSVIDSPSLKRELINSGELSEAEYNNFEDDLWARRYAGGLSSISLRISHEAQLNGSADFTAQRLFNFGDKLGGNVLMRHTKEIWDPTQGTFRNEQFDIGYVDVISSLLDPNKTSDEDFKRIGLGRDERRQLKETGNVRSYERLKWGSKEFWDDLIDRKLNPPDGHIVIRMTYLGNADEARKQMWGPNSFFHEPTIEGYLHMKKAFEHLGTGKGSYTIKDEKRGDTEINDISKMEEKWIEMLERALEYMNTEQGEKWMGDPILGFPKHAVMREWINTARRNEMIGDETQEALTEKYLGFKNEWVLNRQTEISVLWTYIKNNKGKMTLEGLGALLKNLFGYVFDDFKR